MNKVADWAAKLIIVNLIWFLFNLPGVVIVLNFLLIGKIEDLIVLFVQLFICSILFLFPATTAMFAVIRNLILKSNDTENLFKQFYTNYKKYYKTSLLAGLIFTLIWTFLIIDFLLFLNINKLLMFLLMVAGSILLSLTLNYFCTSVYLEDKFFTIFKKAILITAVNPIFIPIITLMSIIIIYFSIAWFQFLIFICSGSIIATLSFYLYHRFYNRKLT